MDVSDQAGNVYVEGISVQSNQAIRFHQLYYLAPVLAVVRREALPQHAMILEPADFGASTRDGCPLAHYLGAFWLVNCSSRRVVRLGCANPMRGKSLDLPES
jgi:hypothetical protein